MSDDPKIVDAEVIEESSSEAGDSQKNHLKNNLLSVGSWLRGLYMLLFAVIACVAGYVVLVLVIIQFIFALITGESDERLQRFGKKLSTYLFQILCFLTYNSEDKPFPFMDWPSSDEDTDNQNS